MKSRLNVNVDEFRRVKPCPYQVCLVHQAFLRHPEHLSLREGPAVQTQVILEDLYLLECQMGRAHQETLVHLSLEESPVKCTQVVRQREFRSESDSTDDEQPIQRLLWVQEVQAVHRDQAGRPDLADLVIQGNRCHLSLLLFQTL